MTRSSTKKPSPSWKKEHIAELDALRTELRTAQEKVIETENDKADVIRELEFDRRDLPDNFKAHITC